MKYRIPLVFTVIALALLALRPDAIPAATASTASPALATMPVTTGSVADAVADTYRAWLKGVSTAHGDATVMLKFYAPDAILVATYSPVLLHNDMGELAGYFKKFTSLPGISGTTPDLQTRVYGDYAINTGLYDFSYMTPDGDKVVVPARFTFVYRKVGDQWLIVDHHSSIVPIAL